ncbi:MULTISPECIES: hypothetical protein [unclassified Sphingomonas]|uniref:hypothetical protein n=1 Tax=unclassified Sphingomonas TaxID=196159 RepID=UPI0006FE5D7C|nr:MULTISPECIES: hypothetical protein [unclassified Sphingomonas]KQX20693.1 hypothetical protein ASD17_07255 [Sphingomonas sp. Root1294]KQY68538.1 hypothetical protein ASD39_03775 [Sphingomonas sp. Root50]KRB87944.1 hypothetical protein ASE22_20950 [Sphingomonas sp. Root720]
MAIYRDGLKIPTQIWEAAAMHQVVMVACNATGCRNRAVFDPHGLWGVFWKRGWDDSFGAAARRFYCRPCSSAAQRRVKRASMTALPVAAPVTHRLPAPDERAWKRFLERHRG